MSTRSRKCPACGGHRTFGQGNVRQCLDSRKKHPDYPFFNKDGPLSHRDGMSLLGYKPEEEIRTLYIEGYSYPWSIPSHIAQYITENSKDDLESFEKLCKWVYDTFSDSQNHALTVTKILSNIETHIRSNTSNNRWITSK